MHARGEFRPEVNPDDMGLTTFAALQGGQLW